MNRIERLWFEFDVWHRRYFHPWNRMDQGQADKFIKTLIDYTVCDQIIHTEMEEGEME